MNKPWVPYNTGEKTRPYEVRRLHTIERLRGPGGGVRRFDTEKAAQQAADSANQQEAE